MLASRLLAVASMLRVQLYIYLQDTSVIIVTFPLARFSCAIFPIALNTRHLTPASHSVFGNIVA